MRIIKELIQERGWKSISFLLLFLLGVASFSAVLPLFPIQAAQEEESDASFLEDRKSAIKSIETRDIGRHVYALASKKYAGRGSGEEGGWHAARYLANELQKYGCIPGGVDTTGNRRNLPRR